MGLFKRGLASVMAAETKGDLGLDEEVLLVGTVGQMAGRAAFSFTDLMDHLLFIILLFMTLITSLVPFRLQQVAELGSVRIMALSAFPSPQGRMHAGLIRAYFIFAVAGVADLVAFFLQEKLGNQTMPEVAFFAFPLFDDRMHIFHRQIFLCKFLVAVEAFFARKPRFPSGCPRASQRLFLRRLRTGVQ
jgi:hypothetical protein